MEQSFFWMDKVSYAAAGGKGFSVFSPPHLIWLAFLFSGIALFAVLYRRLKSERRGDARKGVALFLILSEIAKLCVVALTGAPVSTYLPLHLCSFAEYAVLVDALWPENRFSGTLLFCAFLPSALMAMLFPTATAFHPLSFFAIHHFILHALIAAYIVARYSSGEIRVRYKGVWSSFLAVCALALPVYFIDLRFGMNFMFLTHHINNPVLKPIWDISGGGVLYVAGLGALVLAVLHLFYGFSAAAEALARKGRAAGK